MKIWNTETHLGAVCNCNGVFTISFFGVVFFVDGGRGKGGTLSMNINVYCDYRAYCLQPDGPAFKVLLFVSSFTWGSLARVAKR